MDNQEFQQHVLKWMERMEERQHAYEERVDKRFGSLAQDVSWIKGKLEGRANIGIGSLLINLWRR